MKPRDFLDLASELVGGTGEAEWRFGVSRAYYAVFHTAGALLRQFGFLIPQSDRAHGYIWLRLSNCGHALLQALGPTLLSLRRARNFVDYELNVPFYETDAVAWFNQAYDSVEILEPMLAASTSLSAVVATIRAYERDALGEVTWQGPSAATNNGGGATDGT